MKIVTIILLPILLFSQIYYSGKISPKYLLRISDGTEISLPFRVAELQLGYSIGDFELKTNTAVESRWQGMEADLELREAYLQWYPQFGEVKAGKIIHTWGAADGNNPTDNINPYDFYYMFIPGADRKIGILSGSVKAYWNIFSLEGIFIPEYKGNRLPFNEDDFPIQFPYEPEDYLETDRKYEYGARLQTAFNFGDISISYFDGFDDSFSILDLTFTGQPLNPFIPTFGFRETKMMGTDLVIFFGNFTYRGEVGYFITDYFDHDAKSYESVAPIEVDAKYLQYVLQIEYSGFSDINIGAQLLGTDVVSASGMNVTSKGTELLTTDNFRPSMGTPFAMIAEKAIIVNGSTSLFDRQLELEAMSLINLDETGYLVGINVDYSPFENWKFNLGVNKFIGDDEDPDNRFNQMEDFSHVSLGLEYNF